MYVGQKKKGRARPFSVPATSFSLLHSILQRVERCHFAVVYRVARRLERLGNFLIAHSEAMAEVQRRASLAVSVSVLVFQRAIRFLSVFPSLIRPFLPYTPFVQGHFAKLCRLKTIFSFSPKFSHKNYEKRQRCLPLQSQRLSGY